MMHKAFNFYFQLILILVTGILISGCDDQLARDPIPHAIVDIEINLNNQEYLPLQQDGGYVEIQGGVRGIILYKVKNQNQYRAFEKNSPYQANQACATVNVDGSGLYMVEGCANSQYNFKGEPISGPARLPLKQYPTYLDGSFLIISNQQ